MNYTEDEKALIWLCRFTNTEPHERSLLVRAASSPCELFLHYERYVKFLHGREENVGSVEMRRHKLETFLKELDRKDYFAVTAVSDDYPEQFKSADPPIVLYGAGRRELLKKRMFCIVGSRITPTWAQTLGMRIAETLSQSFVIVTGIAEGGDLSAVRGALKSGNLICVLPCGLDNCYPAAHENYKQEIQRVGLLLSEYAPGEKAKKYSFHARNRILAGLAEGTLVLSAGEHSGALITAYDAVDYGRDVFAFPYNPGVAQGVGCNELLKKGAYVCTGVQDILETYHLREETSARAALSPQESEIYGILREEGEMHAAVLAERTGLAVYEVAAILASLELKGFAVKSGGNKYSSI